MVIHDVMLCWDTSMICLGLFDLRKLSDMCYNLVSDSGFFCASWETAAILFRPVGEGMLSRGIQGLMLPTEYLLK